MSEVHVFLFFVGLLIALCGVGFTTRCRHRRTGKLPEDIQ